MEVVMIDSISCCWLVVRGWKERKLCEVLLEMLFSPESNQKDAYVIA